MENLFTQLVLSCGDKDIKANIFLTDQSLRVIFEQETFIRKEEFHKFETQIPSPSSVYIKLPVKDNVVIGKLFFSTLFVESQKLLLPYSLILDNTLSSLNIETHKRNRILPQENRQRRM